MPSKSLDFSSWFLFEGTYYLVRPVREDDIETLRIWKNANRQFFHFKEIISPEQQIQWFTGFAKDEDKQLFVCELNGEPIACVGFKKKRPGVVELFNLICGHPSYAGRGFMRGFYHLVITGLQKKDIREIELEVLKSNTKAIAWYLKQGYKQIGEEPLFLRLSHSLVQQQLKVKEAR